MRQAGNSNSSTLNSLADGSATEAASVDALYLDADGQHAVDVTANPSTNNPGEYVISSDGPADGHASGDAVLSHGSMSDNGFGGGAPGLSFSIDSTTDGGLGGFGQNDGSGYWSNDGGLANAASQAGNNSGVDLIPPSTSRQTIPTRQPIVQFSQQTKILSTVIRSDCQIRLPARETLM